MQASQVKTSGTATEAVVNPNKALWEKGDFTAIAAFMRQSGEVVAGSLGITPSLRVLDLGCGDGTTAVPLASSGADVLGIDIARNLVEAGNKRAAEAGLNNLKFQEGDACNLQGVSDHSFVYASTPGRLRQSHDLGLGCSHDRTFWRRGSAQGEYILDQGHIPLHLARPKPNTSHRVV